MKLIGALATFTFLLGLAAVAAFTVGCLFSMSGSWLTSWRTLFLRHPPLALDPAVSHFDVMRHSHDRSHALLTTQTKGCGHGNDISSGECPD